MDILLQNTLHGLIPMYDSDFDEKKKLKIGELYKCKIVKMRNYEHHKKYFALLNCAWEYQNEATCKHFKNTFELFRKTVEIAAGYCDLIYSIERKEWIETPKSISFDKMDQLEFNELYNAVKDVLFTIFLKNISEEEFMKNLIGF